MKLFVLDLRFEWNGQEQILYPVMLQNEKETVLVDCGYPGFMPLLEEAAQRHHLTLQQLTAIIITHHDNDHMGALFEIKQMYPHIKIYSSKEEAPYIAGRKKSLRLQQAEDLFACLPEEQKDWASKFQEMLRAIQPVKVDETINEEGELSFLKGVEVVFTPGHMPGHISLYLKEEKTLIAADAVVYENGELNIANPSFTLDLPAAVRSAKKLQQMDIQKMICYHGGVVESDIQKGLEKIVARYS
jgi:glyoxylase-like metal-dependent hydrolase (beta-lactamase superfamily II)